MDFFAKSANNFKLLRRDIYARHSKSFERLHMSENDDALVEAVEAAARAVAEQLGDDWEDNVHTFCGDDFQMTPDGAKAACRAIALATIHAAIDAWPGMVKRDLTFYFTDFDEAIILPLPQEKTDAEA